MPAAGADLWRAILDPDWRLADPWNAGAARAAAERLAGLVSPALAAWLLAPVERRTGSALLDADAVQQSRLMNRFTGGAQRRWLAALAGTGIPYAAMKGIVFAHTIYPDPDLRTVGDLDVLVRRRDRDRLVDFLAAAGFAFEELPSGPWGFISDASYQPMVSADGACTIDVHVEPDCYPAYRSLTAERLFAAAETLEIDGLALSIPSSAHQAVLCLTNAAKDKFGPYSVRKLTDLAVILRGGNPDWQEIRAFARDGHFSGPAQVAFALLARLGLPAAAVPADLRQPPRGMRARVFEALVRDWQDMFAAVPGTGVVLWRELALCTEPDVALHNAWLRLRGLVAPRRGIPAGHRPRQ